MDSAKFLSRLNANGLTSTGGAGKEGYLLKTDDNGFIDNSVLNGTVDVDGVSGDFLVGGALTVTGNLLVNGTTTTIHAETLTIDDNIIVLNNNVSSGSPTENGGIQVRRGASTSASILWDESTDTWKWGLAGAEIALQPLDADLTAIAALTATDAFFYRPSANTWTSVGISTGLQWGSGTLSASAGLQSLSNASTTGRLYYLSAADTWSPVTVNSTYLSFSGGTLSGTGAAVWGSIGGTLSAQTDLNTALGLKAPAASPTFTGTVVLPSTTSIGTVSATELGYVDGVTSAIQTQFAAKVEGPASATDNYPVLFDGTSGKLVKAGSGALDTIATRNDFKVTAGSGLALNLAAGYWWGNLLNATTTTALDNVSSYIVRNNGGTVSVRTGGFLASDFPLAVVVASGGSISSISDRRSWVAQIPGAANNYSVSNSGSLAEASNSYLPTQLAVKTYVDARVGSAGKSYVEAVTLSPGTDEGWAITLGTRVSLTDTLGISFSTVTLGTTVVAFDNNTSPGSGSYYIPWPGTPASMNVSGIIISQGGSVTIGGDIQKAGVTGTYACDVIQGTHFFDQYSGILPAIAHVSHASFYATITGGGIVEIAQSLTGWVGGPSGDVEFYDSSHGGSGGDIDLNGETYTNSIELAGVMIPYLSNDAWTVTSDVNNLIFTSDDPEPPENIGATFTNGGIQATGATFDASATLVTAVATWNYMYNSAGSDDFVDSYGSMTIPGSQEIRMETFAKGPGTTITNNCTSGYVSSTTDGACSAAYNAELLQAMADGLSMIDYGLFTSTVDEENFRIVFGSAFTDDDGYSTVVSAYWSGEEFYSGLKLDHTFGQFAVLSDIIIQTMDVEVLTLSFHNTSIQRSLPPGMYSLKDLAVATITGCNGTTSESSILVDAPGGSNIGASGMTIIETNDADNLPVGTLLSYSSADHIALPHGLTGTVTDAIIKVANLDMFVANNNTIQISASSLNKPVKILATLVIA